MFIVDNNLANIPTFYLLIMIFKDDAVNTFLISELINKHTLSIQGHVFYLLNFLTCMSSVNPRTAIQRNVRSRFILI